MAEALVGGAFLSAALQVLFDRMASREVLDFIQRKKVPNDLLEKLKITLMAINGVLNDAEEKQITNLAVKEWLDKLKAAVYDAEDLLDEIATEALRRKSGSRTSKIKVRDFISTCNNPSEKGIRSKIKNIIGNIDFIARQKDLLGLKEGVGRKPSPNSPRTSLVDESGVYGRDDDKEKIIKLLLSDDASGNGTCVIPIVGMGGVGKTTLAQLLYNDEKVNEYFDVKAWVYVSDEFNVFKVTKTVLESVDSQTYVDDDLNFLQVKLREKIMGKKFLLVLDDIWNENYNDWDNLRTPFKAGAKGSKIIVTTRNESVALIMCTVPSHNLEQLSYEASWLLFTKHAFENGSTNAHPNLEVVGKKIVEKCKGLPLAVKTLGGLLRCRLDAKEWDDILKSNIWDFSNDKSDILPALRLSYHYLPTHLKRCFAYCSLFPKDYNFKKDNLVLQWIAEGFVQKLKSEKRLEEVGDEYFRELSSRSFFQQSSGDESSYVMHDLINDLAQFVSGEFSHRLEGDKVHGISRKVRHFSYSRGQYATYSLGKNIKYDSHEKFGPFDEIKCLRTFLPINPPLSRFTTFQLSDKVLHELLPTLSCLRVLSLSHYENITELSDSIGNLKHLRYLDLSHTAIKRLPEVICTLHNLQTLMLSCCHSLTGLPADIGKLSNLRHLDVSGTSLKEMPIQMSGLKSLQTLTTFIVGKHNGLRVRELGKFQHLRGSLSILKLQNVSNVMDALEANLKDKKYLDELLLEWDKNSGDSKNDEKDILDRLQPSTNLKRVTIKYYGATSFPNWLGDCSFSNVTALCLSDCIYCLSLPPLGQLPSLEELSIVRFNVVKRVGLEFYGTGTSSEPFQKLKTLAFEEMSEWEEWSSFEGRVFPSLEVLVIKKCPMLRGDLPSHLPFLEELLISECQQLMASIPRDRTAIWNLELHGCHEVVLSSVANITSLEYLEISELPNITCLPLSTQVDQQLEKMPSFLHNLASLTHLAIVGCRSLLSFPETGLPFMLEFLLIDKCDALVSLQEGMFHSCTRLQRLIIIECSSLVSFPRASVPSTLNVLYIEKCKNLELLLPEAEETMHDYYASLKALSIISSCDSLKSFPLGLFPKLNYVKISDCMNLESLWIPDALHEDLSSLSSLGIYMCPKLVSFPKGGLPTPNLTNLYIHYCENLKSLPERMHNLLPSLQKLVISECPELESFPEGGLPSNLKTLNVCYCDKLTAHRMEWGLQRLVSLKRFVIEGCNEVESFPEEWLLPSTLTSFDIRTCPNLKYLDNSALQHLTSLEKLFIVECPKLQCLPKEGLPPSLSFLYIWQSPLLEKRCQRKRGKDWPKIACIPCVEINNKLIT